MPSPSLGRGRNTATKEEEKLMGEYAAFIIEDPGELHLTLSGVGSDKESNWIVFFFFLTPKEFNSTIAGKKLRAPTACVLQLEGLNVTLKYIQIKSHKTFSTGLSLGFHCILFNKRLIHRCPERKILSKANEKPWKFHTQDWISQADSEAPPNWVQQPGYGI